MTNEYNMTYNMNMTVSHMKVINETENLAVLILS